jgi:hypothetical protein
MCYIDGQNNKYSVLNECNRMLKYNIQYRQMKFDVALLNYVIPSTVPTRCHSKRSRLHAITT